jgi:ornithine cyclodeaminase/alanine dehydrogenase
MPVLYLSEHDVERLVDMPMAIAAVEEAFRQMAMGRAMNVPRVRARTSGIVLHTMSAAAEYLGLVGWKCYTTTGRGARFHVGLYDAKSGELVALIEADRLGQLRTGATTGVAAARLALPSASEMGLFGAGHQAETQLEGVAAVRRLSRVLVYSRNATRIEAFAARMAGRLGIEVTLVARPEEAVKNLPIVVTATTSATPVFRGSDVAEGALVCAVGSNWPNRAEVDTEVIQRANAIVCDSVEACRNEAGDFREAIERGVFSWSSAIELADVVAGRVNARRDERSVVVFKSVGLAIEDVALGAKIIELAKERGVGREL